MAYEQPSDPPIPDEVEILRVIRARLAVLRPLVAEHDRLAQADKSLEKALSKL